jgi:hypothetical protein
MIPTLKSMAHKKNSRKARFLPAMFTGQALSVIVVNGDGVPVAYSTLKQENIPKVFHKEGEKMFVEFHMEITPID